MEVQKLSAGSLAIWESKTPTVNHDDQVGFLDTSFVSVNPVASMVVIGYFVGEGLLGVSTVEGATIRSWLRLANTNFQIGVTDKTPDALATKHIRFTGNGEIEQNGFRQFACGSIVEHTLDEVQFRFVGEGLLVVRYQPPTPRHAQLVLPATQELETQPELVGAK